MRTLFIRMFLIILLTVWLCWYLADWLTQDFLARSLVARHKVMVGFMVRSLGETLAIEDALERARALEKAGDPLFYQVSLQPISGLDLDAKTLEKMEGGELAVQVFGDDWSTWLNVYRLDRDPNKVVVFTYEAERRAEFIYYMWVEILIFVGLALVILVITAPVARRLRILSNAARAFGKGDLEVRVPQGGPQAIGNLGLAFNQMADQLGLARRRHEVMTHALSHEVRTPLARLRLSLDMAEDMDLAQPVKDFLADMHRDVDDLENLSNEMLSWARLSFAREPMPMETVDLVQIASQVKDDLQGICPQAPIHVLGPKVLACSGNRALLVRALGNLVRNAQKYGAGPIEIQVESRETEGSLKEVSLTVSDHGPGIPRDAWERVWLPFAGLDRSRARSKEGYGLGLAIVQQIAESHGGGARLVDHPSGGARVRMFWPALG